MNISEYAELMLKGLGVAVITRICASVCREAGRGGIADYVELAGRLEILLLCLPLMSRIIGAASELFSLT